MPTKSKILIVEDEAVVRDSVRDWLTEDGYEVGCVTNGEEAILRVRQESYGVIVLDLRLPDMDGLAVFDRVKDLSPKTKGIIMTAYPSRETREKARRLGVLAYLAKPFKVEELERIVAGALDHTECAVKPEQPGAVSYRICTHRYECGSCDFAQDMEEAGREALVGEGEVGRLLTMPGWQRPCRYASMPLE